jgi:hypothetical protein
VGALRRAGGAAGAARPDHPGARRRRAWFRLRNSSYRRLIESSEGHTITDHTATRDLKALVEARLLEPRGERRGRIYVAAPELREIWATVPRLRRPRRIVDDDQAHLPGL